MREASSENARPLLVLTLERKRTFTISWLKPRVPRRVPGRGHVVSENIQVGQDFTQVRGSKGGGGGGGGAEVFFETLI